MGSYILCQTKIAEVPYYLENISTNIYSLEELCYYLYHNLYLIDDTVLNEELFMWLEDELGLSVLAGKLSQKLSEEHLLEDMLYPIFKEINYLSYEELRILKHKLTDILSESSIVRAKKKGDALVENQMYVNAIHIYQKLLAENIQEEMSSELKGAVFHNLGCAYSYLFQMEKALEYFWKAYEETGSRDAMITYLLAYRSMRTTLAYSIRVKTLGVSEETLDLVEAMAGEFQNVPEQKISEEEIEETLKGFLKDYHRSTGS